MKLKLRILVLCLVGCMCVQMGCTSKYQKPFDTVKYVDVVGVDPYKTYFIPPFEKHLRQREWKSTEQRIRIQDSLVCNKINKYLLKVRQKEGKLVKGDYYVDLLCRVVYESGEILFISQRGSLDDITIYHNNQAYSNEPQTLFNLVKPYISKEIGLILYMEGKKFLVP